MSERDRGKGREIHKIREREIASVGAKINMKIEACDGWTGSLINNLIPSANGCRSPKGPTMLGPLRSCMYPKTFRSTKVRKATAIKTIIKVSKEFAICEIIMFRMRFELMVIDFKSIALGLPMLSKQVFFSWECRWLWN